MPKIIIHTDDLPQWAIQKQKLPRSYLDHLAEAVHVSPDGKGMISAEEIMMRQHFDAAIKCNVKAMNWLLRKIINDNAAELSASGKHPQVRIEGVHYFQPLAPVLALLGCITIQEPDPGTTDAQAIKLAPWFAKALHDRCRADKLEPVTSWLDAGGQQKPRVRDRDRFD